MSSDNNNNSPHIRNINRRILVLILWGRSHDIRRLIPIDRDLIEPFCETGDLCCLFSETQLQSVSPTDEQIIDLILNIARRR